MVAGAQLEIKPGSERAADVRRIRFVWLTMGLLMALNIVSAQYGIYDALDVLKSKYADEQRVFNASNEEIGTDGWPGYNKTLVVTYELCNTYTTVVAKQNEVVELP